MKTDSTQTTPRDFFLNLGAFVALYVSVVNIITILFQFINTAIPDVTVGYVDPYSSALRWSIASLIVVFPLYVALTRMVNTDVRETPAKGDIWVRKWGIYLTLFVAGAIIVGDLIFLIDSFLGGELTSRFALKVISIAGVLAAVFGYYWVSLKGYWVTYPQRSHVAGYVAGILILIMLGVGFTVIGSPSDQRALRLDTQRVQDLQQIQGWVVNHWDANAELPQSLDVITNAVGVSPQELRDPETEAPYVYQVTGELMFELCATFDRESIASEQNARYPVAPTRGLRVTDTAGNATEWEHPAGEHCFTREIHPEYFSDR